MGPICCLVALGHDGMTYLSFFLLLLFFFGPTPPPLSLATFTAASHFTALSLWDYNTKISLCRTNCCHDNGRGAVREWEHKCDCVSNCKSLSNVYMRVCVQYGHVSGLYFSFFWRVSLVAHVCNCRSACVAQTCSRWVYPFVSIFQQHKTLFSNYRAGWHLLLQKG